MEYKVLNPIIYSGKVYNTGDKIDIVEKDVAENCLKCKLITNVEEIGENTTEEKISENTDVENKVEETKTKKTAKKK